jgi:hypothetical protein
MNIISILKVVSILWRVSKPVAERIVRDAEYRKISSELANSIDLDRVREAGDMETWRGTLK